MTIETEIKLIVSGTPAEKIHTWLINHTKLDVCDSAHLRNVYFDTAERTLQRLKFGLRTRHGEQSGAEQTIKTAGRVVDGLHQRAEYNCPLVGETPQLADFPPEIWPSGLDLSQLQHALLPLFSTDFARRRWLVEYQGSKIEVVWDHGVIRAAERSEPINELELELKQGSESALRTLAEQLGELLDARPGNKSKAARGYALLQR